MEKTLFEQMGGTYSKVSDYLFPNITVPEESSEPIGVWGQRHARYLKEHRKVLYMNLLTSGKLNAHLAEIDKQAEDMFCRLVNDMAEKQDVTEQLKATDQMVWVGKMNAIRNAATEIINQELIYV